MDDDWGTLVWLAMTTGMRRGELVGLRFSRLDLDDEVIDLRRNWVRGKEKDTKTHQNRRIALDSDLARIKASAGLGDGFSGFDRCRIDDPR